MSVLLSGRHIKLHNCLCTNAGVVLSPFRIMRHPSQIIRNGINLAYSIKAPVDYDKYLYLHY